MERSSGRITTLTKCRFAGLALAWILSSIPAVADDASSPDAQQMTAIENRLNDLSQALAQTQKLLEESRAEIQTLHSQLDALRTEKTASAAQALSQDVEAIREQQ